MIIMASKIRHSPIGHPDSLTAEAGDVVDLSLATITVALQTVAALGTTQANAGLITATSGLVNVTGADATVGVRLPAAVAGRSLTLKNNANAALKVWPAVGDGINAAAVDALYSMAAFTSATFTALDGTTWVTTPLVAS